MNTRSMVLAGVLSAVISAAALAAPARDGAVIENSGSTNVPGYTLRIWSDGTTLVTRHTRAGGALSSDVAGRVPQQLASNFFNDVRGAKDASASPHVSCMKSASFGSSTRVTYHGWTSGDLECPGNTPLAEDVHAIAQASGANRRVRSIPMLPNEVRRPESTPGQASPSPDSASPAP